jgi:hypothetical protein
MRTLNQQRSHQATKGFRSPRRQMTGYAKSSLVDNHQTAEQRVVRAHRHSANDVDHTTPVQSVTLPHSGSGFGFRVRHPNLLISELD